MPRDLEFFFLYQHSGRFPDSQIIRRDAIEQLKKSIKTDGTPEDVEKDAEAEVQKVHDKYIKKVDELYAAKEKEIMTV